MVHGYQRSRYEFKYLIDEPCARRVRDFVRPYLGRDEYAIPSMGYAYPCYSMYLDGPGCPLLGATVQAQMNRFKLRIRYYDFDPNKPVFCEIKRRVNDVILKERAGIHRAALANLVRGHPPTRDHVFRADDSDSYSALRRFCELQRALHATPRINVYFEREPWVSPHDDNIRVTFDRKIAAAPSRGEFEPKNLKPYEVGSVILELKFDDRFPTWMRHLVRSCDLYRTHMGKYLHCMDLMPKKTTRPFSCAVSL